MGLGTRFRSKLRETYFENRGRARLRDPYLWTKGYGCYDIPDNASMFVIVLIKIFYDQFSDNMTNFLIISPTFRSSW